MATKSIPKNKPKRPEPKIRTKNVPFEFPAPAAEAVYLVGEFNNWDTNAHRMQKDKEGIWRTNLSLKPGRYEYRFLVDGNWENDPICPLSSHVPNEFGSSNCVRIVG